MNKIETKEKIDKLNETKSWFLAKVNTIDKHLARHQEKREQINKITNKRGIKTKTRDIQITIQKY